LQLLYSSSTWRSLTGWAKKKTGPYTNGKSGGGSGIERKELGGEMSNIKNMIEGASDIAMDGILSRKADREVTDEVFDFIWASVGMEEDAKFHAIDMAASIVKDVRKEYLGVIPETALSQGSDG
jgi:hypothetical protein